MRIVRDDDNEIGEDSPPERIVAWMLARFAERRVAVTTGFGMEGCVLVDMVARHDVPLRVLYLDTDFLFPETLRLRDRLAARYPHLRFERRATALTPEAQEEHYGAELWVREPDTCCTLRKVEPMREALAEVDVWVTGLMRSQSPSRADLRVVEWDWQYQLLKVNPLASWDRALVWEYVQRHDVPYNELHDRGYPSLGCTHCTLPVAGSTTGDYTRDGRWRGRTKLECGLHAAGRDGGTAGRRSMGSEAKEGLPAWSPSLRSG
jgi:phosphoadenosine phosphosulfate reductase